MIKPIKQNLAFGGMSVPQIYQNVAKTSSAYVPQPQIQTVEEQPEQKKQNGSIFHRAKIGVMNFIKGFNNIKDTASGIFKGVAEGIASGVAIGTIGANIVKSKNKILKSGATAENYPLGKLALNVIGGTIADVAKSIWGAVKFIPKLFSSSKSEIMDTIKNIPSKFIKYLSNPTKLPGKNSNKLIILSTVVALGCIAYRAIEGKIKANKKNADIDHALNEGHMPTK